MRKVTFLFTLMLLVTNGVHAHGIVNPLGTVDSSKNLHIVNIVAYNESNGVQKGSTCGGVLFDKSHVLTAAHCVAGYEKVDAVFGKNVNKYVSKISASGWFIHEDYDSKLIRNDIALVKLSRNVSYKPVNLPRYNDNSLLSKDISLYLYGWGGNGVRTGDGKLYYSLQRDVSNNLNFKYNGYSSNTMIAATYYNAKNKKYSGACKGDSGGPLIAKNNGLFVVGIVSYVAPNCDAKYPSVYTRVSAYLGWVDDAKLFLSSSLNQTTVTITGGFESVRVRISSPDNGFAVLCRNDTLENYVEIQSNDAEIGSSSGSYNCYVRTKTKSKVGLWSDEIPVTVFPKPL